MGDARRSSPTRSSSRPCRASTPTRSRPRTTAGSAASPRSAPTTSCSTSRSTGRRATCGCSSTTGPGPDERYLAAGVPWFTTLFGRDSIIGAFQALAVRPQLAIETLEVLARLQATEDDPSRDAEPGKIPHELRTGEMARAGEPPHRPYYGTVDATPLWLVLLGATWDWTGDRALIDRLWPNALRALEWIDKYGDRDGDGFVEYERRTPPGAPQPGLEGLARRDPRPAREPRRARPIALVEVQGYVYDAKRRMAALARVRGRRGARAPPRPGGRDAAAAVRGRVLVRGPALLRDGTRRREAAGGRDRLQPGPLPVERDRVAGAGAGASSTG